MFNSNFRNFSFFALVAMVFAISSCDSGDNNESTSKNNKHASLELLSPDDTGVTFNNILDDDPMTNRNILSFQHFYNGAGVGVGDFDNDGLPDLFFSGNEVENEIYKNLGDLKFENKTTTSGVNKNKVWSSGVSIIDINNDGLLDVYVSQCGPYDEMKDRQNLFYINKGNFVFEEQAEAMGLNDGNIGTQAAFLDYDKDGDLDVYLLNESKYVMQVLAKIQKSLENEQNMVENSGKLYRNNGDLTFTDVTKEAGVLAHSFGLGVLVTDFNSDNYPDLYVANDYSEPDRLYINQKDGTFKDEVKSYTNHIPFNSMGCDIADINNDGFMDLANVDMATADHYRGKTLMASMDSRAFNYYVKDRGHQYQYMFNTFQLNNGNGSFSDIAGMTGLQKTDWSWAALLADVNLDGNKDYFVSNGYKKYARDNDFRINLIKLRDANGGTVPLDMREELYKQIPVVPLKNLLFINQGDLTFEESPKDFAYPDVETYSYGTAYADLDNDGDLELIINNIDKPAHILKNNSRENKLGNYLTVKLQNPNNTAIEYQSRVKISYDDQIQVAEYSFVRGYESSMDQRVFFGLGDQKKIDKIEVFWADGNKQTIKNPKINSQVTVVYKEEAKENFNIEVRKKLDLKELQASTLGIDYRHQENDFEDFDKEVLLPQRQSTLGPAFVSRDINGDGLDDLYCGGASGQQAAIYIQNQDGSFSQQTNEYLGIDKNFEDLDACFVDPNQDGKLDLVIASGGGGEMEGQNDLLNNRFYANINGKLSKTSNVIPAFGKSTYRINGVDLNGNGREELFVCGAAQPGRYPLSETNQILSYDGRKYVNIVEKIMPEFESIPLVRDVSFFDVNQDKLQDVLVVSEWGTPTLFVSNSEGKYTNETSTYIPEEKFGWWASIAQVDVDNDGDMDFVLGNMGENLKHKVSDKKPLYLYASDFDKNGTVDCVLAKEYKGKIVPARGRECSSQQMPFILDKFETYASFADADINDIFGEEYVNEANTYKSNTFSHYILKNEGDHFEYEKLPRLAQIAPLSSTISYDLNQDGYMDLIIGGNYYDTEYETPRQDAGRGLVLMNDKGNGFIPMSPSESGLDLNGNFRKLAVVKRKTDNILVAAENNGPLKIYKLPASE